MEDLSAEWYRYIYREYRLTSTVPVLRLLNQQSNCFVVVERGRAMANMSQERALQASGELRGALAGWGGTLGAVGGLLGSVKSNEAATLLTPVDNRSGVQVAAAEGSAKNFDWGLGDFLFSGSGGGSLGRYTRTPQGKVIAGAFVDAYNQLVVAMRGYAPQAMGDRGLGTGSRMAVDGAAQPESARGGTGTGSVLGDAQQRLNDFGYEAGSADGKFGGKTARALRQCQADLGIDVTGRLDTATRAELAR